MLRNPSSPRALPLDLRIRLGDRRRHLRRNERGMASPWRLPALLALVHVATGCANVGWNLGPDAAPPPQASGRDVPALLGGTEDAFAPQAPPEDWWHLYRDPRLDALVEASLAANTDLRVALANVERARAIVEETKGPRWPTVNVRAGGGYGVPSGAATGLEQALAPSGFYDVGVGASYQFDLYGRTRRAVEAAEADAGAVQAARELTRVSVIVETARAYVDTCVSGHQLEVARNTARLQEESLKLFERQREAGLSSALDVVRSRALLSQARAAIPSLAAQQQIALHRLAVLTGRPPALAPTDLLACREPPRPSTALPIGDAAGLLRRRPDVRAAERRLAAATARIGVATTELYPSLALNASVGATSLDLGRLASGSALRFSVGPVLSYDLPLNGVARARIAQAEAGTRAALADFDRTVLLALQDLETVLTQYARELERHAELTIVRDQSAEAVEFAHRIYVAGAAGPLDVLDSERTLANAEAALAASSGLLSSLQLSIFLALGSGGTF